MGIWKRLSTLVKSNVNEAISNAEDPEKMLNQLIIDMKKQLIDAKKQVAVAIADERRLSKQLEQEQENTKEWERKAMLALKAGNEDLARQALARKTEHDNMVAEYEKQYQLQKNAADKLRTQLKTLNKKIDEAQRKKNLLIARQKRAEAQKTITETMSGMSDTSAFDAFDRMSQKVDQIEAEAEATSDLVDDLEGADLNSQFAQLESGPGSAQDDALLELKKKMGLLSDGSDTSGS